MALSILYWTNTLLPRKGFEKSSNSLLYIQNTYDFQHGKVMETFPWLARTGVYVNFIGTCDKPLWMDQRHVEIPPKCLWNGYMGKKHGFLIHENHENPQNCSKWVEIRPKKIIPLPKWRRMT